MKSHTKVICVKSYQDKRKNYKELTQEERFYGILGRPGHKILETMKTMAIPT